MSYNKHISILHIKEGFESMFPGAIKKLDIEEDEDPNSFVFELELNNDADELIIPDGIFVGYVDFKGKYIDGFIDGDSFMEFVEENK